MVMYFYFLIITRDTKVVILKMIIKDIQEDMCAVNANPIAVLLFNRGFHALLFYRVSNILYKSKLSVIAMIITRIIHILYAIDISYKSTIRGGVQIIHGVGLVIGEGCVIESGCILYQNVTLGIRDRCRGGFPVIEKNSTICAGAVLLGNIIVGEGAVIGANAVVLNDVPSNSVAVGNPARILNK